MRNARNRPELGGLLSITSFNQSGNRRADERFDDMETFEAGQLVIHIQANAAHGGLGSLWCTAEPS